ncbi:peptide chain release factor 1 [Deinococcus peraridilitoris]|uniref:Peptide chain release factor 1 n=1 Tax=Deinococcus peraridilitoris (strain DSM 19664 / LMG 22246 / CIP 109416 / KR-200) TaxID=937777 RepID=K9ZW34_DEIPD|nr:peptide chain release factor 1 [Deinococcus peraridilitoris]AFZ65776.1 peptide chain release factor 1 [Deinococcus peraridilitoris DSM 19664]
MLTDKLTELEREYHFVERDLADPAVLGDPNRLRTLTRRHSELSRIMDLWREHQQLSTAAREARDLLADPEMHELAEADLLNSTTRLGAIETELDLLLIPSDPSDHKNAILELRAGAGGDEAGLFAADLLRMYERYAEQAGLRITVLDANESDLGGFSKVTAEVMGEGAFKAFKFERGVHRVQRVPATETQGRIHTSTVTVAVLPEAEETEVELNPNEVRIDVFRSQGAGGQSVNTTDSAVRAAYRPGTPDEIIVVCQETRSQIKNREKALNILRARLAERQREAADADVRASRQAQIGSGDRSEKVRTYNYAQDRVTDHRLQGDDKNFPLGKVIAGDLSPLVEALQRVLRDRQIAEMADAGV